MKGGDLQDDIVEVFTDNNRYGAIVGSGDGLRLDVGLKVASKVLADKLTQVLH